MNRLSFVLVASLLAAVSIAQEEVKKPQKAAFTTLPLCRLVEGIAEVQKPGGAGWMAIEEGKFYPLGSWFRTREGGRLSIAFGRACTATISGDSSFGTRSQALGGASRTVVLGSGVIDFGLEDNLAEGSFFVTAPGFTIKNPAGDFSVVYEDSGDIDKATVKCITGSLGIEGRHFDIPVMRAANEIVIRTSHDHLCTFLYGKGGDYVVKLDQGMRIEEDLNTDGVLTRTEVKSSLDWHLSPATRVVINRSVPAIGERMSVHTMAFNAAGDRKSECSFCEGRAEVNSGELVAKAKIATDELTQDAAEATETVAATDVEDVAAEDEPEAENDNESTEDETDSDSEEEE